MQKKQHCLIVILHLQGQTVISFTLTGSKIACSKYSFGKTKCNSKQQYSMMADK